ncbi:CPBP family intramembrane glutamic endopeptidase [Ilumatobacter sp.]|uniref:CPBP family intramembrane glutamic endopeptidase n=1 Tax=Ilumatobacter sp. TaxID=1967498 RepID=UPI003AF484DE
MNETEQRRLGVPALIGVVIVYLAVIQGVGLISTQGLDAKYGEFPDIETLLRGIWLPVGLSVLLAAGIITWLGWWRPVVSDDRPVQRWVWIVPAVVGVTILVVFDYGNLSSIGGSFTVTLLLGSLLVGTGEELMFRGLAVTTFRANDFSETRVALWSSLLFGAAHLSNLIVEGPGALVQVVIVSFGGYLFYLMRRVSGTILLPILAHALWDAALFSGRAGPDPDLYPPAALASLCTFVLLVVLWVRRDRIEPDAASHA